MKPFALLFAPIILFSFVEATMYTNLNERQSILYEDAEDNSISRWSIVDKIPAGSSIQNILDTEVTNSVIELISAENYSNQFQIGGNWNNKEHFHFKWDFKTTQGFIIDVLVSTKFGKRILRYTDNDHQHKGIEGETIYYGLGYDASDGKWHRFSRNLAEDVEAFESKNKLQAVEGLEIRATARIDNIELFASTETVYEDAQSQKTSKWRHYLGPDGASITNRYDAQRKSRVIAFKGEGYANQYIIGDDVQGSKAWRDAKHSHIQFHLQNSDGFILYLNVETTQGIRYLKYDDNYFSNRGIEGNTIYHALGHEASNGKWHTYIRDIEADIQAFEPENKLLYVDGLLLIGNAKIDDLILFDYLHPVTHQAGLALTFDDYNVPGWYGMKETFAKYQVKPTFFVSEFHRLSPQNIQKLKELEAMGAEIGSHTYNHKGIGRDYHYDTNLIDTYLNEQIIPALNIMRSAGFNPKSLAYPFGEHHSDFDKAIRPYFPYLRTTASNSSRRLYELNEIYHKKGKHYNILAGDGIDNGYQNDLDEIKEALIKARKNQEVITLYGHEINNKGEAYAISPEKLEAIIQTAQQLSLKFYTFSEAYQLGE